MAILITNLVLTAKEVVCILDGLTFDCPLEHPKMYDYLFLTFLRLPSRC